MKKPAYRIILVILFISLPFNLTAKAENVVNVTKKVPKDYQKVYSYEYGEDYIARYEKTLPDGSDPYDAYEVISDRERKKVKTIKKKYLLHPKLEVKKLISKERVLQLSEPFIKNPDNIKLSVVDPHKLTPLEEEKITEKTKLCYAYVVTKNTKTLYIEAYDETILGLDEYEKSAPEETEPESYLLKFITWIKSWLN